MLKKGSTATSPSDIAVDVRSVVKVFTQSQRENAGNGVLKRLARPEKKRVYALDNVTFQIRRGEFVAYAGPNGAGKSTLMKALVTVEPPNSGAIQVCGFDTVRQGREVRQRLGYLPQELPMYPSLSVRDFLGYMGELKGVRDKTQVENVLAQVEMQDFARRKIGQLSGGMKRRVGIAQALLGAPPLLILDEPTRGIDVGAKAEIYELLEELAKSGLAIIVVSSELPEIISICHRTLVVFQGRITGNLSKAEMDEVTIMECATGTSERLDGDGI